MSAALGIRARATVIRALFAMPQPVRRLLAGPPVRIDGQELTLDAQLMIRLKNLSGSDVFTDPVEDSRARYDDLSLLIGYESPVAIAAREITIPAEHGGIPATLYAPADVPKPSGLLVYFHGGGFSVGSRLSHDPVARYLASHAGVRVLSVEYRRAPEHRFPAAVDDSITAFEHAYRHATDLGADPDRIAVGGDSAGGNLAAVTAQQAVRRGGAVPAFQLLMYPPTDLSTRRGSRDLFARGLHLHRSEPRVGAGQLHTRREPIAAIRGCHRCTATSPACRPPISPAPVSIRSATTARRTRKSCARAESRWHSRARPTYPRIPRLRRCRRPLRRSRRRGRRGIATRPGRCFRIDGPRESR